MPSIEEGGISRELNKTLVDSYSDIYTGVKADDRKYILLTGKEAEGKWTVHRYSSYLEYLFNKVAHYVFDTQSDFVAGQYDAIQKMRSLTGSKVMVPTREDVGMEKAAAAALPATVRAKSAKSTEVVGIEREIKELDGMRRNAKQLSQGDRNILFDLLKQCADPKALASRLTNADETAFKAYRNALQQCVKAVIEADYDRSVAELDKALASSDRDTMVKAYSAAFANWKKTNSRSEVGAQFRGISTDNPVFYSDDKIKAALSKAAYRLQLDAVYDAVKADKKLLPEKPRGMIKLLKLLSDFTRAEADKVGNLNEGFYKPLKRRAQEEGMPISDFAKRNPADGSEHRMLENLLRRIDKDIGKLTVSDPFQKRALKLLEQTKANLDAMDDNANFSSGIPVRAGNPPDPRQLTG